SRKHHERQRQGQSGAFDGHLVFLHRLQEGGLRLGGGAVDLVGQQNLAKNRALAKDEIVGLAVENIGAGDVRRQQVGGELDSLVLDAEQSGKCLGKRGLG